MVRNIYYHSNWGCVIQINSSFMKIMLQTCTSEFEVCESDTSTLCSAFNNELVNIRFKPCCINLFLWGPCLLSLCFVTCWLDVFPFNLREVYLSNLSVLCVSMYYVVIILCHIMSTRRTESHYLWQRKSLPYWG